eukprot:scaffold148_cov341-Pavlova_lutheri.AAC.42
MLTWPPFDPPPFVPGFEARLNPGRFGGTKGDLRVELETWWLGPGTTFLSEEKKEGKGRNEIRGQRR